MMSWNKNKTALSLMFFSIGLLFFFLAFWIYNSYERERTNLQKDIHYAFMDVISGLEDSLARNLFVGELSLEFEGNTNGVKRVRKHRSIGPDDSMELTIKTHGSEEIQAFDSSMTIVTKTMADTNTFGRGPGMLPILIQWSSEDSNSVTNIEFNKKAVALIKETFDTQLPGLALPQNYKVVQSIHGAKHEGLGVEFYHLPMKNEVYTAVFSNYFWPIVKRIRYNLLLAVLLFGMICFSFFMIYSYWQEQQKLIEIKNDFISNVTHELKTPISTVSVALEALSDYELINNKEKTAEYLAISRKELSRLRILVDKVLKMALFEKGVSRMNTQKLDFSILLDEVLSSMKIQFENSNAEVNKSTEGKDFDVEVDKIHFTNVIYNLLDNALKYTNGKPVIDVALTESNGSIALHIKDNGIGISIEDQKRIFQRFYRVSQGDRHDVKGHGLGLSYVASVIDQHQGEIHLESTPNKGSLFTVKLKKANG